MSDGYIVMIVAAVPSRRLAEYYEQRQRDFQTLHPACRIDVVSLPDDTNPSEASNALNDLHAKRAAKAAG